MKDTKKLILKILTGVMAAAFLGGILFIASSFMGNPITAMLANKAVKQYIEQNYSYLDLEIEKARYNFKSGSYVAMAKSKTSMDTRFAIYYRDGKITGDTYESNVLGMFNTLQRLANEYSVIAQTIVAEELGYENNSMVMYDKSAYENAHYSLELDMKFDKSLPIDAEVTIRLDLQDNSLEGIAKVLTDAHRAFADNGCNFTKYALNAENDGMLVMVHEVTPADIESGELVRLLKESKDNGSSGRIRVFIKGENK
jgi:hypothetical protein